MDPEPGTRPALLISRPGGPMVSTDDIAFARDLLAGARRDGVPVEPVHVATDWEVLPITPDDLEAWGGGCRRLDGGVRRGNPA